VPPVSQPSTTHHQYYLSSKTRIRSEINKMGDLEQQKH